MSVLRIQIAAHSFALTLLDLTPVTAALDTHLLQMELLALVRVIGIHKQI